MTGIRPAMSELRYVLWVALATLVCTTSAWGQDGWQPLFDGSSLEGWTQAGPGGFTLQDDGSMVSHGGMGLLYYAAESYRNFELELDWKVNKHSANAGVFVRFPATDDPWVAVREGYEIQIDNSRDPDHVTGSIYAISAPFRVTANATDEWNTYRIKVTGQRYQIWLNGALINDFVGNRSLEGHIGLQNHDDSSRVAFRNVRIRALEDAASMSLAQLAPQARDADEIRVLMVTTTHAFRHGAAIAAQKEVMTALSETTELRVDTTEDLTQLNHTNLQQYDVLFFANSTLRAERPEGAPVPEVLTLEGSYATYDVMLSLPDNEFDGTLALSGHPDSLTGVIAFRLFPDLAALEEVFLRGDSLTFHWEIEGAGRLDAALHMRGGDISGTITVMNMPMALTGTRTAPPPEEWTLTINSPQGPMDAALSLADTASTIVLGGNALPLVDLVQTEDSIRFSFDGANFGIIRAEAQRGGTEMTGTLSALGGTLDFTGVMAAADVEEDTPTIAPEQQEAIMSFLRDGKGIAVAHAGLDAFYNWPEYREMVGGGLFDSHPWTQSVRIAIEDADNPATRHWGEDFWIRDEIYVLDENPRWTSRVLMSLGMESVELTGDVAGDERNDYPIAWIRGHQGGRVFVTKLGHFADVWKTPGFQAHIVEGLRLAAGRTDASFGGRRVKEVIAKEVWPDDIAVDERGNVWIAELRGRVHRYDAATGDMLFIAHLRTTDPTNIEHGLYGIEVDPEFYDGSPYVYLYYAEPHTFINKLSRYVFNGVAILEDTEEVLLRVPTEPTCCHQGGDLEWGTDSTLFISTGDTGMSEVRPEWEVRDDELEAFQERHGLKGYHWARQADSERSAQNLQDLRGKILRINRDGSIPHDNPFFGQPGVRWEIYAYGLRNPYRFKVDPESGALYIGVVGPDASYDYDEYNVSHQGGENFGWPRTLGKLFYNEWTPDMIPGYVPPMWEYTYEGGGRSATVGPIYRHEGEGGFPALMQNKLFVFDWARRWIKYGELVEGTFENDRESDMRFDVPQISMPATRLVNIKTFDRLRATSPISMEQGPDGSIYLAEFDGFWDAGPDAQVTRYRWIEHNRPPLGDAKVIHEEGWRYRFDGMDIYDPDLDLLSFHWDFGDGASSSSRVAEHTYDGSGTYHAQLTVTDARGEVRIITRMVEIPAIDSPDH